MNAAERQASQPSDLAFAPPVYPGHGYAGRGIAVRVHLGAETVGFLSRQGDAVGWNATAPAWTDAGIIRTLVSDALRSGAAEGRSLDEVWTEVLALVPHDPPREVDLASLLGD